jgi:N-acyl amino acid synthase of PEP-CTERM/exosortase system
MNQGGIYADRAPRVRPLKSALELRYQVYCLECNFLSPDDYPDGIETDSHDERAAHFHALDFDDELVGYVRLVRAGQDGAFPFQKHCELSVGVKDLPDPDHSAEISRLMVRKDYRRRRGDRLSGVTAEQNAAALARDRRHQAPQILLSLYRQMYNYSRSIGIRYWFAAMERPLARSLSRLNFAFEPIGPATDYYGPVAPYLADLSRLEEQVGALDPELLAWLAAPSTERESPLTTPVAPSSVLRSAPAKPARQLESASHLLR